jgi:hypothetical protein
VRTSSFGLVIRDLLYTRSLKNGSTLHCRATRRNLTAYAAKILVKILVNINLTIWKAAIYCTVVAGNTVMVSPK